MQKYKGALIIVLLTVLILLVPFGAMQISEDVNWAIGDFAVAACLLLVAGFGVKFIFTGTKLKTNKKIISCFVLVLFVLLVWAEIAVGIIGKYFSQFIG